MAIERETVSTAIGAVLFSASNFPERVQSRLLGQDMGPLREKLTQAVMQAVMEAQATRCCGTCPPILGGGVDCTCEGNPRCPLNYDLAV